MRYFVFLFAIVILISSCSSPKKSTGSAANTTATPVDNSTRDGSSFEKAIIIDKRNSSEGIAAEYQWLRDHYPGYKMIRQSLRNNNGKPYDVLDFETKDGEKKSIYFDISRFFGKF